MWNLVRHGRSREGNRLGRPLLPEQFMAIQVVAIFLLYMFPEIGLWLPQLLYSRG